jgi:hypothetical protein
VVRSSAQSLQRCTGGRYRSTNPSRQMTARARCGQDCDTLRERRIQSQAGSDSPASVRHLSLPLAIRVAVIELPAFPDIYKRPSTGSSPDNDEEAACNLTSLPPRLRCAETGIPLAPEGRDASPF